MICNFNQRKHPSQSHGSKISLWSKSRPEHPSDVVQLSLNYLREKYQDPLELALDIGCGTGKSTEHLIPHFKKVYGSDLSQAMLDQAKKDYKQFGKFYFSIVVWKIYICPIISESFQKSLLFSVLRSIFLRKLVLKGDKAYQFVVNVVYCECWIWICTHRNVLC